MGDVPIVGPCSPCCPTRFLFVALACLGITIYYGYRVNLSIAMQAMLNHTGISIKYPSPNTTITECAEIASKGEAAVHPFDGDFIWGQDLQGVLLSCYFWGYLVAQFPGGIMAERFSAKYVLFFSVTINIVCSIITPPLTKLHWGGLLAMRVMQGLGGGMAYPACHTMIGNWAPPAERATISTLVYTGSSVGTAVALLTSGAIATDLGWEAIFYLHGGLACPWIFLWIFCVQDTPGRQKFITADERAFIQGHLGEHRKKKPAPFVKILKSLPFWASLVGHTCTVWAWYLYLVDLPIYMKQILHFNIASNSVWSALPYIILCFWTPAVGKMFDYLIRKKKMSVAWARKTANLIASIVPIGCSVGLCYVGCRPMAAVALMTIGCTFLGTLFAGAIINIIDLGHNYGGIMMAMLNTTGTIAGLIVPLFVGWMTKNNETIEAWIVIFWVNIAILAFGAIFFTIFAKGEEQEWNKQD